MKIPTPVSHGPRPSRLKHLSGLVLATAFALAAVTESSAIVYPTWTAGSGNPPRKLRLNIPDSVASGVVRGIIIHGNGAGADETDKATDPELVALAEHLGFAILATGNWYKFDLDLNNGTASSEYNTFVGRLLYFANLSGHPELVHAPWIAEGFSNGGQMAYGLNVLAPTKTIAFVANKGGSYNNPIPPLTASLDTPGLLIGGQTDHSNKNYVKALFTNNRPRGAKWAWVEEENLGHVKGDSYSIIRPFLAECVKLRYPPGATPENGPVTLLNLNEADGWIVNQNTWSTGLTDVHAYADETGNPLAFGWVPNQRIAFLYRAFSTYNKAAGAVGGSPIVVAEELPADLAFNVNMTGQTWSSIEFFEGAESIGGTATNPATITHQATATGYHVFHGVITRSGEAPSATKLWPVFVAGPAEPPEEPPPEPALKVLVDFGPTATTTVGNTDDPANTWNNCTSHSLNFSLPLVDSANAATGITLTITDAFAGNQGTGSTSPTSYVTDAVRDSFYFDSGQTPQLKLTGLDPTKIYNFKFIGSRMTTADSLIRSTRFTVQGFGSASSAVNNATNNTGTISAVTGILPTIAGEITIDLAKNTTSPDINNTSSGVGYLGVLEITTTPVP